MSKGRSQVLVYDTLCEYSDGVICQDFKNLCEAWKHLNGKPYKLVYQPVSPNEDFASVCDLVYKCGNITFLVEEIDSFLSINTSGLDREFLNIVQRGRHREVELIGITQRPYAMPAILRSQCKELYTFRQFENRDIDWLRGILGDRADEVKSLRQFEYIEYVDGSINKRKTLPFSKTLPDLSIQPRQTENVLPEGVEQDDQEANL